MRLSRTEKHRGKKKLNNRPLLAGAKGSVLSSLPSYLRISSHAKRSVPLLTSLYSSESEQSDNSTESISLRDGRVHKVREVRKLRLTPQTGDATPLCPRKQGYPENPHQMPDTKTGHPALHCLFPEGEGDGGSCRLHIQTGSEQTQTPLGTNSPQKILKPS